MMKTIDLIAPGAVSTTPEVFLLGARHGKRS